MDKKRGAEQGNKRAQKGRYPRTIISHSGLCHDLVIDALKVAGINEPTKGDIAVAMDRALTQADWDLLAEQLRSTPEERAQEKEQQEEQEELAIIRADYQWFKQCEAMDLAQLRESVADGPFPYDEDKGRRLAESDYEPLYLAHYLKRHRQAVIVLQERERGALIEPPSQTP